MNKKLELVLIFIGAFIFLSFGIIILEAGQLAYGSDAALLWISGIFTLMGIRGIVNSFFLAYEKGEQNE